MLDNVFLSRAANEIKTQIIFVFNTKIIFDPVFYVVYTVSL